MWKDLQKTTGRLKLVVLKCPRSHKQLFWSYEYLKYYFRGGGVCLINCVVTLFTGVSNVTVHIVWHGYVCSDVIKWKSWIEVDQEDVFACFMQYWIQPFAKDVANVWANKYLVFWISSVNRLSNREEKKMHGLNYIASCCVDSEYHCSIFLLGPWTWPPSTCLFCSNVLLVFLLFSPSLDSGFSYGEVNWKKPSAWKGKCAMFLFRVEIKWCCYMPSGFIRLKIHVLRR